MPNQTGGQGCERIADQQPECGSEPLRPDRAERFCRLILSGERIPDAYLQAGFKGARQNAYRFASKPAVADRIAFLRRRAAEIVGVVQEQAVIRRELTKQYVIDGLIDNVEVSLGRKLVTVTKLDRPSGQIRHAQVSMFNNAAANRALELLGRELGMFEGGSKAPERSEISKRLERDPLLLERSLSMLARDIAKEKGQAYVRELIEPADLSEFGIGPDDE